MSSFYPTRLVDIATLAEVPLVVDQIETYPFLQHESWAPFAEDVNDIFNNPMLVQIGQKHGKTFGQVILRALIRNDIVVIPKSMHRERMKQNFDVFDFELDSEDMAEFKTLDGGLARIFDHTDVNTVKWLLGEYVKKQHLGSKTLY